MEENNISNQPEPESAKGAGKRKTPLKSVRRLIGYKWITENIGFFLFLAGLAIIYIANGHQADKMIRDSDAATDRIKELQYEYKTLKSELMFHSREAEVIKAVAPTGLKINGKPPVRLQLITRNNKKEDK